VRRTTGPRMPGAASFSLARFPGGIAARLPDCGSGPCRQHRHVRHPALVADLRGGWGAPCAGCMRPPPFSARH
jgi:hypothetical protein